MWILLRQHECGQELHGSSSNQKTDTGEDMDPHVALMGMQWWSFCAVAVQHSMVGPPETTKLLCDLRVRTSKTGAGSRSQRATHTNVYAYIVCASQKPSATNVSTSG